MVVGVCLVVGVWAGMLGMRFALLSLGLRFFAVAAESDRDTANVAYSICFYVFLFSLDSRCQSKSRKHYA